MENVIAIVGSRYDTNYVRFCKIMSHLQNNHNIFTNNITIISGGASGVDSMAARWATEQNYKFREYAADWSQGRKAGPIRNQEIVNAMDFMIAIPAINIDGTYSKGTNDAITKAKKANKKCYIVCDMKK